MSITRCPICNKNIDEDYNVEHFDECEQDGITAREIILGKLNKTNNQMKQNNIQPETTSTNIEELKEEFFKKIGYTVTKDEDGDEAWSVTWFNPEGYFDFFAPHLSNKSELKKEEYSRKCGVMGGNVYLRFKGGCEKEDDVKNMYRCGGCGGWFHKECLYKHFESEKEHDYGRQQETEQLKRKFEQAVQEVGVRNFDRKSVISHIRVALFGTFQTVRTTWYHGTNNPGEFMKNGIYKRATKENPNASNCVYLATARKEAEQYGSTVFEVYYDPTKNPAMNNYDPLSWQMRVYEPLDTKRIIYLSSNEKNSEG